jgi:hypothetical protein
MAVISTDLLFPRKAGEAYLLCRSSSLRPLAAKQNMPPRLSGMNREVGLQVEPNVLKGGSQLWRGRSLIYLLHEY